MTGIGLHNPNANRDGFTPFGVSGDQANYLIEKFLIRGADYISGCLFIADNLVEQVENEMHPYSEFRTKVENWLQTGQI